MYRLPIILAIVSCTLAGKLRSVYEWRHIDYDWKCEEDRNRAIFEKRYDCKRIFTIDVEKVPDGRVFVTTPQYNPNAAPASLSTVSKKKGPGGPLLKPYPNWDWHTGKNCKGIISVWRTTVDDCNRLWVLDSGKIGKEQVCLAQLLVFDLKTDKLLQRIEIPNEISHNPCNMTVGRISYPIVETEGANCERVWVYMIGYEGGGLVIYDGNKLWRLDNEVFHPDPVNIDICIAGDNFSQLNGILGLALSPRTPSGNRRLFFSPLAPRKEYSVSVDVLHRSDNPNNEFCYTTPKFDLPSPVIGQAFSRSGVMFFGFTERTAIACWNLESPMDEEHVVTVAEDEETLQYASGIKFTRCPSNPSREQLWVSTNRFQVTRDGIQHPDEINFRILTASVDALINGTKCQL